jgi:hypothetical protein
MEYNAPELIDASAFETSVPPAQNNTTEAKKKAESSKKMNISNIGSGAVSLPVKK